MVSFPSPSSPTLHRHTDYRMASDDRTDTYDLSTISIHGLQSEPEPQGLGITQSPRPASIARVPVGSRASFSPRDPSNPFAGGSHARNLSGASSSNPPSPWQQHDAYNRQSSGEAGEQFGQDGRGQHSFFTEDLAGIREEERAPTSLPVVAQTDINDNDNDSDNENNSRWKIHGRL